MARLPTAGPRLRRTVRRSVGMTVLPVFLSGPARNTQEVLKTMCERAARFNVEKIKPQDLAGAAGPPDEEA